jgi:DNA-directed RNA polymerase
MAAAENPLDVRWWEEADAPLQFLAWCLEYRDWQNSSGVFMSHLPISMDGSCNGLQHLSALLRDEIGGAATNLTPSEKMSDIYSLVAQAAEKRLRADTPQDEEVDRLRLKWLQHGIKRKVVKRSVMTTPYGVTRMSATDYIVEDYLRREPTPFLPKEYRKAAMVLMAYVWPAIGDIVVKGRLAMAWLKQSSKAILQHARLEDPVIQWETPSGFLATQTYTEIEEIRVKTRLIGSVKIRVVSETEDADKSKHASGMAPNFIHSLDAAHLHLVCAKMKELGVDSLAMVHDDYGTHAAHAETLAKATRATFVELYSKHDPLKELATLYQGLPPIPPKGSLDITEVLKSEFFFC